MTDEDDEGLGSDVELFADIIGDDATRARAAKQAFYQRHVRFLYGALQRQRATLLQLAGVSAEDIVQDTFQRAFDRAASFKSEPGMSAERARRRTRAWLGRIAQNLIMDGFRRVREVADSPYLDRVSVAAADEAPQSRPRVRQMREALATLSDREQDILRVTALYFKAEGHQRLPNAVAAELAERWGINNQNLRAIRSRAMKKLRRAMDNTTTLESSP